jgi:cell division initiation protein
MITPADIENKVFAKAVRGYKEEEVDDFLDLIILDMEKLMKENRQLKKELEKSQTQVDRHVSTESSVYETLESAKSLLNDIAASAERRAQVILKDAELEQARQYIYSVLQQITPLHKNPDASAKKNLLLKLGQKHFMGVCKLLNFLIDIHVLS